MEKQRFTLKEAAIQIGVHRSTLARWIHEGKIPGISKNAYRRGLYRFTPDDMKKFKRYKES